MAPVVIPPRLKQNKRACHSLDPQLECTYEIITSHEHTLITWTESFSYKPLLNWELTSWTNEQEYSKNYIFCWLIWLTWDWRRCRWRCIDQRRRRWSRLSCWTSTWRQRRVGRRQPHTLSQRTRLAPHLPPICRPSDTTENLADNIIMLTLKNKINIKGQ